MPPDTFGEEKNTKLPALIASVCFLVVLGAFAYWFVSNPIKEPSAPAVPGGATTTVTTTPSSSITTVTRVAEKVPVPPAFIGDTTNTERRTTLLALAKKSTTRFTSEEKVYILQEFGGERTAVYGFTYEEARLVVNALNR